MTGRRLLVALMVFTLLIVFVDSSMAGSTGGDLGIGDEAENLEGGGRTMLRVILILTGVLVILVGAFLSHAGAFVTIGIVIIVIGAAGKGVPYLVDNTGLAEGATISREAPEDSKISRSEEDF